MTLPPAPRSLYDPPRAGATRGLWSWWFAFLRRTRLRVPYRRVLQQPVDVAWLDLRVVVIPTFAWFALGRRTFALAAAGAYGVSALAALLFLGWTAAGLAAGVMITLHALGIAEYYYSGRIRPAPGNRFGRSLAVLLVVSGVYVFGSRWVVGRFVLPVQSERGMVLIDVTRRPTPLARGETVAYRRDRWRSGHVQIHAGRYLGEVLALPGDLVTFRTDSFAVNGEVHPRRRGMPRQGELRLPTARWFVWPFDLTREFENPDQAADFAQKAALVPEADFLGRPYRRWFLRRQSP